MYNPPHFQVPDTEAVEALVHSHPLGMLVTHRDEGLDANHVPFALHAGAAGERYLQAHLARANPLVQQLREAQPVMVVFRAQEAYISPNWYPSKHADHRQVPTWNYRVVHVHGTLCLRDDEAFVRGVVARLTRKHEQQVQAAWPHPAGAWKMGDADPAYLQQMLQAIVGIEIAVERMEGKFKLSQNREMPDRMGAIAGLHGMGQTEMAVQMVAASQDMAR